MRASSETSDESDDDDAWCASCERCGEVCFGASETLASLALAKHRDGACGARVRGDGDGATRETTPKREYHRKCTLCENFEVNEDDKKQFFAAWG
jgi:Fe-S-cluster-containing hydrogenase component 2